MVGCFTGHQRVFNNGVIGCFNGGAPMGMIRVWLLLSRGT